MMKKNITKTITLLLLTALTTGLAACTINNSSDEAGETYDTSADAEVLASHDAYIELLNEYTDFIDAYVWQTSDTETMTSISKPVATYDINSDGIPELFVMLVDADYSAFLYIYTYDYNADEIVQLDYSVTKGTGRNPLNDIESDVGVSYVVYAGEEENTFYIYYSYSDGDDNYTLVEQFTWDGTGETVQRETAIKKIVSPNSSNTGSTTQYYKDNAEISTSSGEEALSSMFSSLTTCIIYSGYNTDEIYDRFDGDDANCMSLSNMLKALAAA